MITKDSHWRATSASRQKESDISLRFPTKGRIFAAKTRNNSSMTTRRNIDFWLLDQPLGVFFYLEYLKNMELTTDA